VPFGVTVFLRVIITSAISPGTPPSTKITIPSTFATDLPSDEMSTISAFSTKIFFFYS